jgi:hypothetical protein
MVPIKALRIGLGQIAYHRATTVATHSYAVRILGLSIVYHIGIISALRDVSLANPGALYIAGHGNTAAWQKCLVAVV